MNLSSADTQQALRISKAIEEHLAHTRAVNLTSTDLYTVLSQRGLVPRDNNNGLHFRAYLKRLLEAGQLESLLPQCKAVPRGNGQYDWIFNTARDRMPRRVPGEAPKAKLMLVAAPARKLTPEERASLTARVAALPGELKADATRFEEHQRQAHPRAHAPWGKAERALLLEAYTQHTGDIGELVALFQRSQAAITIALQELRELPPPTA